MANITYVGRTPDQVRNSSQTLLKKFHQVLQRSLILLTFFLGITGIDFVVGVLGLKSSSGVDPQKYPRLSESF